MLSKYAVRQKCTCDEAIQESWSILIDDLTMKFGNTRVKLDDAVQHIHDSGMMPEVRILARLEKRPMGEIMDIAISSLRVQTPSEEYKQIFEQEIVDLTTLLPWSEPINASTN